MRKILCFFLFLGLLHACSSLRQQPDYRLPERYGQSKASIKNIQQRLVNESEKLVGVRYRYGGTTPKGFDCSGFTGYVYKKAQIDITRSSAQQAKLGRKVRLNDATAGDLVFFTGTGKNKISHVAMVVSNSRDGLVVIHSTSSKGVRKDNISRSRYWKPKVLFARRILGD